MAVTADTDLSTLTVAQINELIADAGSAVQVDEARFLQKNASDEYQYEVIYFSAVTNSLVTNHVFIDYDLDGDPFLQIDDLDPEEDLFPDD